MRDFFRPLRRKLGVLTLVIACGLMAGWIRSISDADGINVAMVPVSFLVVSIDQSIVCITFPSARVEVALNKIPADVLRRALQHYEFKWNWCGFAFATPLLNLSDHRAVFVPYWALVLPVTLLSTWLLFGRSKSQWNDPVNHA